MGISHVQRDVMDAHCLSTECNCAFADQPFATHDILATRAKAPALSIPSVHVGRPVNAELTPPQEWETHVHPKQ